MLTLCGRGRGVRFFGLSSWNGGGTQINPAKRFFIEGAYNVNPVSPVNTIRGLFYGYEERI